MDDINSFKVIQDSPPPLAYEKNEKLSEKYYSIKNENKEYDLIITLYENKLNNSENIFNFQLLEQEDNLDKYYSYENAKCISELMKLFLISVPDDKEKDKEKKILEKIEKFHLNNNVQIIKNKKNDNIFDLVYSLKTYDDDDIKFIIELTKTGQIINKEKDKSQLINEIKKLKTSLQTMEQKYDKIIKEQNEKIIKLEKRIENLELNNHINNKIFNEENQLIFKSDISLLNSLKTIHTNIDGSRGLNDFFEPYHLRNDPNTVYIAIKCKEIDSEISYIDILKMKSINDIKKIKKLSGFRKRIVFIKYFRNPYTSQQYLIAGDREIILKTWEIIDENNYKLLHTIITNYGYSLKGQSMYNSLIYFKENRSYIYTTTITNNYSRFYDLDNGAFLKDISITYYNYTLYLITYKEYIVDCCINFIMIYNPLNEEVYSKIENAYTKGDNHSACIIYDKNNTDYLYISNSYGYVIVFDLKEKQNYYNFELKKDLYYITFWDINHLIVAQYNSSYLAIINIDNKEVKNLIECKEKTVCIKKILLNKNEELLLTSGEDTGDILIHFSSGTPLSSKTII